MGFQANDTAAQGVTTDARAIRIRRALDANTVRWLGAFLVGVMLSEGFNGERNHYRKRELHELIGTIE